jgi:hypothetical protein
MKHLKFFAYGLIPLAIVSVVFGYFCLLITHPILGITLTGIIGIYVAGRAIVESQGS